MSSSALVTTQNTLIFTITSYLLRLGLSFWTSSLALTFDDGFATDYFFADSTYIIACCGCYCSSLLSPLQQKDESTPSVTPSASPTVVSQVSSPSLSFIADDGKIKSYVHSVLASMLSQPSGQVSLGANPFFSAPSVEVPDIPSRGLLGGDVPRAY